MKIKELINQIESEYKTRFPNSHISVKFWDNLGKSVSIRAFIAGDKIENSGHYWDNDMISVAFNISTDRDTFSNDTTIDSECPEDMVMESYWKYYHHKPIFNPRNVYDSTRFPFRKVKGDSSKIIKGFGKFCDGMKSELINALESDKIHPHYIDIVTRKVTK